MTTKRNKLKSSVRRESKALKVEVIEYLWYFGHRRHGKAELSIGLESREMSSLFVNESRVMLRWRWREKLMKLNFMKVDIQCD